MKQKFIIFIIIISAVFAFIIFDKLNKETTDHNIELYRGKNAFYANQYNLAQKYFIQDLSENPNRPESLYLAAQSFMKGRYQNFNKSIKYYKQYLAQYPKEPPLSLKLIQQMKNVGMLDELKKLSLTSNNELYKAVIWENLNPEKALRHLVLVPNEFKNVQYYLMAARIYSTHHKYQEVVLNATKAIHLSGLHKNNYYLLSQAYRNLKDIQNTKETLKVYEIMNLVDSETDSEQQLSYLNELLKLNNELQLSNDFNSLYITLLIRTNRLSEAKDKLNSINLTTLSNQNRVQIISAINKMKAYDLAIIMYHETKNAYEIDEYVMLCQIGINHNKQNELLNVCEQAYESFPHSAPILYWHGVALLKTNQNVKALNQIASAINHAPWMNSWIIHLAELYLLEGKVNRAKQVLNQSIDNSPLIKQFKLSHSLQ